MKPYLPCDGLGCPCADHVDTETHVPVCPIHGLPLVEGETPGTGRCVAVEKHSARLTPTVRRIHGFDVKPCRDDWPASSWVWKPRDLFHGDDVPPNNGWKPAQLTEEARS